jgi:hypothetical protein
MRRFGHLDDQDVLTLRLASGCVSTPCSVSSPSRPNWRRAGHERLRAVLPRPAYDYLRLGGSHLRARASRGVGRGRVLPDFLLIGAPKAGTTTLHAWMAEHPLVVPSTTKEVHYFDYSYYRGVDWYRSHFPTAAERDVFAREHGRPFLTGESSPTYLSHRWAPERIKRGLPDVRLLAVLRNPVDRAYSQFQMSVRESYEDLSFQDAIAGEEDRLRPEVHRSRRDRHYASHPLAKHSYLYRSHYDDQFARWLELFPRERFHVIRAEDLDATPEQAMASVFEFLGLPPHTLGDLPHLHTARYEPMPAATRAWLVDYFRPRNERLSELLGFDLDWDR